MAASSTTELADACRAGDLHADRHRPAAPSWSRSTCARRARCSASARWPSGCVSVGDRGPPALRRCSTRSSPTNRPARSRSSTCCCSPICCRRLPPAALALFARGRRPHWYVGDAGAAGGAAGLRLCDAVAAAAVPGRVHRRLARASASSRPTPIRRSGWRSAWRCWSAACCLRSQVLRLASAR